MSAFDFSFLLIGIHFLMLLFYRLSEQFLYIGNIEQYMDMGSL